MKPNTENSYQERILRVLQHIQENLDRDISMQELSGVACFSAAQFHRFFKGMVGESVGEHVRRLRLERAAQRLLFTERSVTDIGLEAGYETTESFSRSFKRCFAASPSLFRQDSRKRFLSVSNTGVHYLPPQDRDGLNIQPRKVTMNVEVKTVDSVRVAFMRHTGPYFEVERTWNLLCAWAAEKQLLSPETMVMGMCHDDPQITPPDKIRYDACLSVPEDIQAEGPVGIQQAFGGLWGTYRHIGPYEGLQETYNNLMGVWLPQSGQELRDTPSIEIYRSDPNTTPPQELITDIYVPLK
ncbi:MAG: AraC family transcriptional regulator [Desulfovibrionaceae bacterium]